MTDTVDTPSRNTRSRAWCFTINNYSEEDVRAVKLLPGECVCGIEKGENGTPHLQGVIRFESARTFQSVKKMLERAHIEKCQKWNASKNYCSKDGEMIRTITDTLTHRVRDPLSEKELYPFQKRVLDLMTQESDERSILWFWEPTGGAGKTSLAKSLCIRYPKEILYLSGKTNDIKFAVASFTEKNTLKMAIFDFTRTVEDYVPYEALESIKNGIFFSGKYEARMCVFESPHVVCFANFPPCESKLSADRWVIERID